MSNPDHVCACLLISLLMSYFYCIEIIVYVVWAKIPPHDTSMLFPLHQKKWYQSVLVWKEEEEKLVSRKIYSTGYFLMSIGQLMMAVEASGTRSMWRNLKKGWCRSIGRQQPIVTFQWRIWDWLQDCFGIQKGGRDQRCKGSSYYK